jgi:TonB-dependent starch-binding outer membrane protein SusC
MKLTELLKMNFRHFRKKVSVGLILMLFVNIIYAQEQTIKGYITDETNAPVVGATITIKGTTKGTNSDVDGKFSLNLSGYQDPVIVISYMGYLTEEVIVGTQTEIDMQLLPDIQSIDQVVVVGYGVQKKSDLTGAVATVSSEDLVKHPVLELYRHCREKLRVYRSLVIQGCLALV